MSKNSRTAFDNIKYEIAQDLHIQLNHGYNGDLSSRDAGRIGGGVVKRVFESYANKNYRG